MALMKSAALLPGAHLGSRTPAMNTFLPKTPGPDAANKQRPRAKRRNEMVYHVAVSENGSPIEDSGCVFFFPDTFRPTLFPSHTSIPSPPLHPPLALRSARAASAVIAPVAAAAASSSSSSSSSSTYGGAIQIGVGVDAVLLEDESQVDGMDGEEAARMLDALRALEARVAGLKQKVAEKAASAVAAGGDGGK
jgi:hypothetical protein